MDTKKVWKILPAQMIDMGGFPVKQALPTQNVPNIDPFLLLHHGQIKPVFKRAARTQGVGPHPHRGFSPVTFVIEGEVHHRETAKLPNQVKFNGCMLVQESFTVKDPRTILLKTRLVKR